MYYSRQTILFLSLVFLCSSCCSSYIPRAVYAPSFTKSNEFDSEIKVGTGGNTVQLGYAITDNIAITSGAQFIERDRLTVGDSCFHKQKFFDINPGYYYSNDQGLRMSIYAGVGFGSTINKFRDTQNSDIKTINNDYAQFMIQPSIGFSSNFAEISLTLRTSIVNYGKDREASSVFGSEESVAYFDPALTLKLGGKNVKVVNQIGLTVPIGEIDIKSVLFPLTYNLGLNIRL
ncbi:MAG: hypothetical protein ACJAZ3_000215 [Sphingobacteriales bacterium]|jgi:hypothetical protein